MEKMGHRTDIKCDAFLCLPEDRPEHYAPVEIIPVLGLLAVIDERIEAGEPIEDELVPLGVALSMERPILRRLGAMYSPEALLNAFALIEPRVRDSRLWVHGPLDESGADHWHPTALEYIRRLQEALKREKAK